MPAPLPSNLIALLPKGLDPDVVTAHALLRGGLDGAVGETLLLVHAGRPVLLTRDAPGKPFGDTPLEGDPPLRLEGDALRLTSGGRARSIPLTSWLDRELAKSFVTSPGGGASTSFGLAQPGAPAPAPAPALAQVSAPPPPAPAQAVFAPAPAPQPAPAPAPAPALQAGGYQVVMAPYAGRVIIMAIKLVRELSNLGLAEAKRVVEQGGTVLSGVAQDAAQSAVAQLNQVGCSARMEPLR